MKKKDYYEILGVQKSAEEREIKKAYKRLAVKYHPDRNQFKNTENKFKEVKEAYEILIDPKKRNAYDQYGHAAFDNSGSQFYKSETDFGDIFGDVFGDIFGGGRKKRNKKGADLCYNIEISLEEAVKGVVKNISVPMLVICHSCYGIGTKKGKKPHICSNCNGSGNIHMTQGFFTVQQTCSVCHGKGSVIKDPCNICRGLGKINQIKKLLVKIPSGIDTGDKVRLHGEGEPGGDNNTLCGDLYVQINVQKHSIFKREDNNLYCEVPISFSVAALGGEISVPTLNGKIKLRIPKETQTGRLLRIRGKGVKSVRKISVGDLLCRIIVETPVNLNENQRKILQKFSESLSNPFGKVHNPKSKNFLDGVKKFFDNFTN